MNNINLLNQPGFNFNLSSEQTKLYYDPQVPKNDESDDEISNCQSEGGNKNYNNGRWNQNEHYKFLKGCLLFGNNWKKVFFIFYI